MQRTFHCFKGTTLGAKMTVLDASCSALTKKYQPASVTDASAVASRGPEGQQQLTGYFQQLYHAPNGNLFSVLSPLQRGRGGSMKPAFLCRQQPQQGHRTTRSRSGRRGGGNRCLKFHNFIPSESITSEKDDGSHDDVWKVHAECKLQEEHGTKQIMVSQWSVSSSDAPPSAAVPAAQAAAAESSRLAAVDDCSTEVGKPTSTQLTSRLRAEVSRRQPSAPCIPSATCPERGGEVPGPSVDDFRPQHQHIPSQGLVVSAVTGNPAGSPVTGSLVEEEVLRPTPGSFLPVRSSELFSELASSSCGSDDVPNRSDAASASPPCGIADATTDASAKQSEILFECLSKRNRRKPSQTRRVVPYRKYLSLLENGDATSGLHPLDLSMKTRARATEQESGGSTSSCCFSSAVCSAASFAPCCLPACSQPYLPSVPSEHYRFPYPELRSPASGCFEKSPLQVALEAPLPTPPSRRLFSTFSQPNPLAPLGHHQTVVSAPAAPTTQLPFGYALYSTPTSAATAVRSPHPLQPQAYTECSSSGSRSALMAVLQNCRDPRASVHAGASTSPSPSESPRGLRKPSQRSLIKQKLEDTFKQNGFLVKTKQVSDGDATFCKFRQLRKYTRYYLKSWHHHLPAEVHKLWKGFLPPKTLPGSGGPVDDVTRDAAHGSLSLPQ